MTVCLGIAKCNERLGRANEAEFYLQCACDTARKLEDVPSEIEATLQLGQWYYSSGQNRNAMDSFEAGLALSEKNGHELGKGKAMMYLANCLLRLGENPALTLTLYMNAHDLLASGDDPRAFATLLNRMGVAAQKLSDMKACREFYKRSMELASQGGDRRLLAKNKSDLGFAYMEVGKPNRGTALH